MHRIKGVLFALGLTLFVLPSGVVAQDSMAGDWDVDVTVMGQQIPLVLHITRGENNYEGTYDSPAQGGFGVPIRAITAEHPDFKMELETGGPPAILEGKHDGDTLKGSFTQATATGTFEGKRKATAEQTEGDGDR